MAQDIPALAHHFHEAHPDPSGHPCVKVSRDLTVFQGFPCWSLFSALKCQHPAPAWRKEAPDPRGAAARPSDLSSVFSNDFSEVLMSKVHQSVRPSHEFAPHPQEERARLAKESGKNS